MSKDTSFASVPDDILIHHIFVYFSFEDLLRCRLVCKLFKGIGSGDLEVIKKVYQATVSIRKLVKTGKMKKTFKTAAFLPGLSICSFVDEQKYQNVVPDKLDIKENFFNNLLKFLRDPVNVIPRIKKKITWLSREKKLALRKEDEPFNIINMIDIEISKLQNTILDLKYAMRKGKEAFTYPLPEKKRPFAQMIEEDIMQRRPKKNRRN